VPGGNARAGSHHDSAGYCAGHCNSADCGDIRGRAGAEAAVGAADERDAAGAARADAAALADAEAAQD